jgi:hypothetical protein
MEYLTRCIRGEIGGTDLNIGIIGDINSSALEVACPPPGIGAKKVQESSRRK